MSSKVQCQRWKDCAYMGPCPHKAPHDVTESCENDCSTTDEDAVCQVHGGTIAPSKSSEDERSMEFHEGWVKGFFAGKRFAKRN
jgi:hypothetical protein